MEANISHRQDFKRFAEATYDHVYRVTCLAIGNEDVAAEGTQEAYTRAFARWRRLSDEPWIEGWVITTAINCCKRALRRHRWRTPPSPSYPKPMEDAVPEEIDLLRAIKGLSLRQREAVLLHYLADVPVKGVADLMHVSEGTVKAHLAHARRHLKSDLEATDV